MRSLVALSLLATACAEPATYCNRSEGGGAPVCYPTERERAAAWASAHEPSPEAIASAQAALVAADEARKARERAADRQAAEVAERERQERQRQIDAAHEERERAAKEVVTATIARQADQREEHGIAAISAIMCSIEDEVKDLNAQLGRAKRVEAIGGVPEWQARREIARELVDDADELEGWRESLSHLGAARMPCAKVAGIEACRHEPAACTDATRGPGQVWAEQRAALWTSKRVRPTNR